MNTKILLVVLLLCAAAVHAYVLIRGDPGLSLNNTNRVTRFDSISGVGVDVSDYQWYCLTKSALRSYNHTDTPLGDYDFNVWQVTYKYNVGFPYTGSYFDPRYSNGAQKFDNLYHFIDYPLPTYYTKVLLIHESPIRTQRDVLPDEFVVCNVVNFPYSFYVCEKLGPVFAIFNLIQVASKYSDTYRICFGEYDSNSTSGSN